MPPRAFPLSVGGVPSAPYIPPSTELPMDALQDGLRPVQIALQVALTGQNHHDVVDAAAGVRAGEERSRSRDRVRAAGECEAQRPGDPVCAVERRGAWL